MCQVVESVLCVFSGALEMCCTVQYSIMQYSTVQCSAVQSNTVHCSTVQYNTVCVSVVVPRAMAGSEACSSVNPSAAPSMGSVINPTVPIVKIGKR